jgi:hypothetical protein
MARLPRLLGSVSCAEGDRMTLIREAIWREAGLSCCRAGAAGPLSKDTILILDKKGAKPLYFVKAGAGAAVDSLLRNEADWLRRLRDDTSLAKHVPGMVAHRSGEDFCFVAQYPVSGNLEFSLGALQLDFLRKLQKYSLQPMRFEDSNLFHSINSRMADLDGHLTDAWSNRIKKAMRRITESFSDTPILLVAAHNDFTPWNIRLENSCAYIFDWEHAANEQLPLFDPLHFVLLPLALRSRPTIKMVQSIDDTLQLSKRWLGNDLCYQMQTQALAYLVNLCILYLWAESGKPDSSPVLKSYERIIDYACRIDGPGSLPFSTSEVG